ncbi:MAG: hypothetical protein IJO32_06350 [Bacilli bacterium]|nr:hypothetical protein [Bacilli bacterium]
MKKYKLILSIDDQPIDAVYTGSLEELDNYILNNNINNVADLFKHINNDGKYDDRLGTYKFEIFSLEKPIRKIDLIYAEDIRNLKSKYNGFRKLEEDMFEKFVNDLDFNEQFLKKIVNPYTRQHDEYVNGEKIINENRIHAWELINFQEIYRAAIGSMDLTTNDINQRIKWEKEKVEYDIIYENKFIIFCRNIMGVKNNKTQKWKSKYDEKREFFTFFNFFDQTKPINTINVGIQNQDDISRKLN